VIAVATGEQSIMSWSTLHVCEQDLNLEYIL